jgi:hypothetical protein
MLCSASTVLISNRLIAPFPYVPSKMDAIINYDEAAGFLNPPPPLEPHPEFANIRALKKHVIKVLSQLYFPQSTIHG